MMTLKYPLFDGEKVWEGAAVTIENGIITSVSPCDSAECGSGFLMPGLIDAHTHMGTEDHIQALLQNGITATCDVSAPAELAAASDKVEIIRSAGMVMGVVVSPKAFVEKCAANGARYIKVLLFNSLSIGKSALCGIVKAAHEKGLKVAVHATEIATVQQSVDAGADILLHVPMKEAFPRELAEEIARKGISIAPTLVMMETFAYSGRNGYEPHHYENAQNAVKLLRECGVTILAATDANPGTFAPGVAYGTSLHREMELLTKAGLTQIEVLAAATSRSAENFGLNSGRIAPGQPATMVRVNGRPDREIADSTKIARIWVKGKPVALEGE